MRKTILSFTLAAMAAAPLLAAPAAPAKGRPEGRPYIDQMLKVPEIKAAQEKVWDARLALYAAKHDRALAGIAYRKAEVEKNNAPEKTGQLKALDEAKANADKVYDLSKQLIAAERAQDWDKVRTIRQEMAKVRMGNRAMMRGARQGMKPGPGAAKGAGPGAGMPIWGDEMEE
jgi:hypothetical protein